MRLMDKVGALQALVQILCLSGNSLNLLARAHLSDALL
jgi:hypothetical protein